jgi:hypothetical protein
VIFIVSKREHSQRSRVMMRTMRIVANRLNVPIYSQLKKNIPRSLVKIKKRHPMQLNQ